MTRLISSLLISSLLIANRGEIALRIMRTCARLGIRTIAVYSDADRGAAHVAAADEALRIGPAAARDSYLRADAIMEAVARSGAEGLHPGYGFLSEKPELAALCAAQGCVFIGPSADRIAAMGPKIGSKRIAAEAGVPSVPGYIGDDQSPARLLEEARRIGFPLMVKASAGGGGRGMRRVFSEGELLPALDLARREAEAAFGDASLLIERLVLRPRHLEVQVAGDKHGNVVHLFERDCSVQRNNQKVLEEAPAPNVPPAIRAKLLERGVALARTIAYDNLGTIEFILEEGEDDPWFLEMNTRLQVEHPVTEAITGLDLVEWQLRIACGEALPLHQGDIRERGHAIEARVTAERADQGFRPDAGGIVGYHEPASVRVDSGVRLGSEVTLFYDSLVAKVIAHGGTREVACARLAGGLRDFTLLGPATTIPFLIDAVEHPIFAEGRATTRFIEDAFPGGWRPARSQAAGGPRGPMPRWPAPPPRCCRWPPRRRLCNRPGLVSPGSASSPRRRLGPNLPVHRRRGQRDGDDRHCMAGRTSARAVGGRRNRPRRIRKRRRGRGGNGWPDSPWHVRAAGWPGPADAGRRDLCLCRGAPDQGCRGGERRGRLRRRRRADAGRDRGNTGVAGRRGRGGPNRRGAGIDEAVHVAGRWHRWVRHRRRLPAWGDGAGRQAAGPGRTAGGYMTALARRIVVTGGTSGIGLAAACRFAADPTARIVLNGRNAERGEAACGAVRARHPSASVHFIAADVSSATGADHLVTEAARHLGGGLDVLVTAAGGDYAPALFHDTSLPDIDGIVRHWLLATMYCCHFALPLMADGGAVVTVASDAAKVPTPGEAVVGAAMSGIAMFSRTLAMEAKRRRIRVNVVTPSLVSGTLTHDRITVGGFSAKLFEKASRGAHLGIPEPDDVAAAIEFLSGPGASHMTGQVLSVNGGISAG